MSNGFFDSSWWKILSNTPQWPQPRSYKQSILPDVARDPERLLNVSVHLSSAISLLKDDDYFLKWRRGQEALSILQKDYHWTDDDIYVMGDFGDQIAAYGLPRHMFLKNKKKEHYQFYGEVEKLRGTDIHVFRIDRVADFYPMDYFNWNLTS